jgi:maltooligosyltrehalose trehalohydrolase
MKRSHRMPFGAECYEDGTRFRLWAPKARKVELCLEGQSQVVFPLSRVEGGWHELTTTHAAHGSRYRYQIDGALKVPDPASRFQPLDVHGPSQVVDPAKFDWQDHDWRGRPWEEAVIYELHVGAFTPEGTFAAATNKLDYLSDLGVTAIELMPVGDFPGSRNWGYDGVLPFAPDSSYGQPDDLKTLVQAAHAIGLMVFLDVVYNHFGPDGNYLRAYCPEFFTLRYSTPWGDAINFGNRIVREFFIHNALFWLEEYHLDGLRFDAVHAIRNDSTPDILLDLAQAVRNPNQSKQGSEPRFVHLLLENEKNQARYLRHDRFDAQWNDDIHHAAHVLVTAETDGYYADYAQRPICQLGRCLTEGFAYQNDFSAYHGANRGEVSRNLPPTAFVSFLQNHDQVGNRAFGERILELASPEAVKAIMAILLLAPSPPLLFMGEEFGARTPFLFFCDFQGDLAKAVTDGRRNEFRRFQQFASGKHLQEIPDPNALETFLHSKLDWHSLNHSTPAAWRGFYRELLSLRQTKIVPLIKTISGNAAAYRVLQANGLVVSWSLPGGKELRLAANLGQDALAKISFPGGEIIYQSDGVAAALEHEALPPWSVLWSMHA